MTSTSTCMQLHGVLIYFHCCRGGVLNLFCHCFLLGFSLSVIEKLDGRCVIGAVNPSTHLCVIGALNPCTHLCVIGALNPCTHLCAIAHYKCPLITGQKRIYSWMKYYFIHSGRVTCRYWRGLHAAMHPHNFVIYGDMIFYIPPF